MAYELQQDFSSGEVSPRLWLRKDMREHSKSCRLLRNMIPTPWGPAESRKGFEFIEDVSAAFGRIFDFDVNFSESFAIVATESDIFIIDKLGFALLDNLILNPAFGFGGLDWTIRNNVTFAGGVASLKPNPGNLASIRQKITSVAGDLHRLKIQTLSEDDYEVKIGSVEGGNDVLDVVASGPEFQIDYTPLGSIQWLEIVSPAGGPDILVDVVSMQAAADIGQTVVFPSPWTGEQVALIQEDMTPNSEIMYFVVKGFDTYKLTRDDTGVWTFEVVAFTFGPEVPNPWVNDGPGTITFHDGRMWLGGSEAEHVTLWASVPHEYENFDFGDPIAQTPSDALRLPLDKHGEIQWLLSNKALFVGLDTGEHVVFGNQGPLDVDDAQTEQHSAYGSTRIQAMTVNEQTVYVNTQGRTVRAMDYSDSNESFASNQLSFIAEHITEGFIVDAAYGSAPFGIIWFVTALGDLISCATEKDQGTLGWSKHHTQGDVIAVETLRENGRDVPWILVRRGTRMFAERYSWEFPNYLDSSNFQSEEVAKLVWDGYDHLIGYTVQVLADRAVHPDVVVAADGTVTLNYEASNVNIGLGYPTKMVTLPKTITDTSKETTFSKFKSWSKIVISVLEGSRPIVNGEDLALRYPITPMDTAEPMKTEYLESSSLGYDFEGLITIEQDLPIPLTIAGVGGKLSEDAV